MQTIRFELQDVPEEQRGDASGGGRWMIVDLFDGTATNCNLQRCSEGLLPLNNKK